MNSGAQEEGGEVVYIAMDDPLGVNVIEAFNDLSKRTPSFLGVL